MSFWQRVGNDDRNHNVIKIFPAKLFFFFPRGMDILQLDT